MDVYIIINGKPKEIIAQVTAVVGFKDGQLNMYRAGLSKDTRVVRQKGTDYDDFFILST